MFDFYINFYYFPPVSQSTAYRMPQKFLSPRSTNGSEKPVRGQIVTETGHRIHIGSFKGYSRNRMETDQVNPAIQSAKQFE